MLLRRGIGDPGDQFPRGRGKGDGIEFGLPGPQLHRESGFIASYPQLNFLILLLCGNVAKIMVAKSGFVAPGHYGYQAEAVAEMIEITRHRLFRYRPSGEVPLWLPVFVPIPSRMVRGREYFRAISRRYLMPSMISFSW